jgi:uncharacterized membrane protein YgaE (UPF0421/DUF939 family)
MVTKNTTQIKHLIEAQYYRVRERWSASLRDAFASAIAASLAWILSAHFFSHAHPVFAAISAIVCLSPGLPSHGKQAVGLIVGVATGIVIGELMLFLPAAFPLVKVSLATLLAILVASSYGLSPVVPIQSGVSAVMILIVGPADAGGTRMIDVAVGACVGLFFSQVLMTPNPVRMIDDAARGLLEKLTAGFKACIHAMEHEDHRKAQSALQQFSKAHDSLVALDNGIASARYAVRWSLRGRFAANEVAEVVNRYDRRAIRLYASALLFGESFANAYAKEYAAMPEGLRERLIVIADICAGVANGSVSAYSNTHQTLQVTAVSPAWQHCIELLENVEEALAAFQSSTAVS